jgi:hypothetical protein
VDKEETTNVFLQRISNQVAKVEKQNYHLPQRIQQSRE